jgi:hypothetical protein
MFVVALVVAAMTGCASTKTYFVDRGRDAADILTCTIGKGGGATAKIGPVHAGLFIGVEHVGLRGGELISDWKDDRAIRMLFDPLILMPGGDGPSFGCDSFDGVQRLYDWKTDEEFGACMKKPGGPDATMAWARGKKYYYDGVFPFVMLPSHRFMNLSDHGYKPDRYPVASFFQVDVAAGMYYTVRVGVNPAELLDFLLGWFGIDILRDDIEMERLKE